MKRIAPHRSNGGTEEPQRAAYAASPCTADSLKDEAESIPAPGLSQQRRRSHPREKRLLICVLQGAPGKADQCIPRPSGYGPLAVSPELFLHLLPTLILCFAFLLVYAVRHSFTFNPLGLTTFVTSSRVTHAGSNARSVLLRTSFLQTAGVMLLIREMTIARQMRG